MMDIAEAVEIKNAGTPEETTKTIFYELKRDLGDWMMADRDLVWRPAIELIKEDNEFIARALLPGVDAKDIEVLIGPEMMLIKGETHRGEYGHTKLLRSLRFPRPVNPDRVLRRADRRNAVGPCTDRRCRASDVLEAPRSVTPEMPLPSRGGA